MQEVIAAMRRSAQEQSAAVIKEATDRRTQALAQVKQKAKEETRQSVELECKQIRAESGRRICAAENEARADLFRRREEIRLAVFRAAEEQIVAFTQTPAYGEFLLRSAENVRLALGQECAVLGMREADRPFAAQVSARLGRSVTLHTDPFIRLGGITVTSRDGQVMIDDTLDSRLTQQQQWFMEQSGLVIE